MSESKTYIFGENQNGGSNGMLGLLAPLLQKQGVDPNVLLAMKGNNGMCGEAAGSCGLSSSSSLWVGAEMAGAASAIMVVAVLLTR